jgi:hypothetical protein
VNNYQIILYILYWHKCQCWQVAQHECKFRICSIRCLEFCRLDMPINCLRKMEKATLQPRIWKFLRKYIDCCFFKILSCHSVYLSHAILSRRSFVAALFCRGALLSWRSFVAALILRLSFVARSFVARSNVVDSWKHIYIYAVLSRQPEDKEDKRIHSEYVLKQNRIFRVTPTGERWVVPKTARANCLLPSR